ncbi:hypothetical protein ACFXG4_47505 [Nocardia sp. NPDC059246]|uniref:hypothetical protein n=1 Tax=unclassified Nocardia TaxID=2637762 RepID=UPI00369BA607
MTTTFTGVTVPLPTPTRNVPEGTITSQLKVTGHHIADGTDAAQRFTPVKRRAEDLFWGGEPR